VIAHDAPVFAMVIWATAPCGNVAPEKGSMRQVACFGVGCSRKRRGGEEGKNCVRLHELPWCRNGCSLKDSAKPELLVQLVDFDCVAFMIVTARSKGY
jgi:hypothetical protein